MLKCIAFDCFGTVFDMRNILPVEIRAYVRHVRESDFSPYIFPDSWWNLKAHPDASRGVWELQRFGFQCVAMSNGTSDLIEKISKASFIEWDHVVDLVTERIYKPHVNAYRMIEKQTGYKPSETLMVTANPTFGDIEGSAAIGMRSQIIRQPDCPRDIIDLAEMLIKQAN